MSEFSFLVGILMHTFTGSCAPAHWKYLCPVSATPEPLSQQLFTKSIGTKAKAGRIVTCLSTTKAQIHFFWQKIYLGTSLLLKYSYYLFTFILLFYSMFDSILLCKYTIIKILQYRSIDINISRCAMQIFLF